MAVNYARETVLRNHYNDYPEEGGSMYLRNVTTCLPGATRHGVTPNKAANLTTQHFLILAVSRLFCSLPLLPPRKSKVSPVHAIKVHGRSSGAASFFTSTPDGGEWSTSHPKRFPPKKESR